MENKSTAAGKNDVMKTLREKSKGRRRGKIILAVLIILVLLVVLFVRNSGKKQSELQQTMAQQMNTEEVTKRSLIKSVGATGTIVSVQSKDLSVSLTGVEVAAVNVAVGDTVEAGDELLVFDTSDIEESLADAEETLAKAQQKNSISQADAQRNVEDAQRTESYQVDSAQTSVDSAKSDYDSALSSYESAYAKISDLKTAESNAYSNYSAAQSALAEAEAVLAEKTAAYEQESDSEAAKSAYETALASYNTALANVTSTLSIYEAAKSSTEAQQSTIDSLYTQVEAKANAYDSAVKSYDNTVASQASSVASAKSSQSQTALGASTDTEEKQVQQYQEQLEEGVLTAPISGIVTALNYEAGDTYTQGTILTIQDCSSYEVEAQIGEYDISDIEVGQRVLIKTEATGDEELEGTVNFVSPTATASATAGTSGGEVNYEVRISVDTPNDRLRLDMSASLSIIIEQHEDVLTVPYNAVQTDEDGNSFVQVVSEDGTQVSDIAVVVVMESNYYTEIAADGLGEGQKVRIVDSTDDDSTGLLGIMGRGGF